MTVNLYPFRPQVCRPLFVNNNEIMSNTLFECPYTDRSSHLPSIVTSTQKEEGHVKLSLIKWLIRVDCLWMSCAIGHLRGNESG